MSVLRFAPSPNGELHLGHAYSALLNADIAANLGGRLLLRIEDIDVTRCTPAFEAGIYADLKWLGVPWEEPARRQSEHFADYASSLEQLKTMGLIYPAFMSRGEVRAWIADFEAGGGLWRRDPDGVPHYPPVDRCLGQTERRRLIANGTQYAWRLDMEAALASLPTPLSWREFDPVTGETASITADPARWGDVILARSDIPTSYHLSVVLDDALQGVTHVVRGRDLYEATGIHRLLQSLLDLPEPLYHHHRLILDPDGRKLSKSMGATGLRTLRESGVSPADIRVRLGLRSS